MPLKVEFSLDLEYKAEWAFSFTNSQWSHEHSHLHSSPNDSFDSPREEHASILTGTNFLGLLEVAEVRACYLVGQLLLGDEGNIRFRVSRLIQNGPDFVS